MRRGWTEAALGQVATIDRRVVEPKAIPSGTLYVGLENVVTGGGLQGVRPVAKGALASSKFSFGAEHVLFGKLRPNLAKSARPGFAGVCSTDILPIRPGPTLDGGYLAHYLASPTVVALATQRAAGANLPRLSSKELERFRIPLPPLDVQRRIARLLDYAGTLRTRRREALGLVRRLLPSVLFEMTIGDGAGIATTCSLDALIAEGDRINYGVVQPGEQFEGGVPLIRVSDLHGGRVRRDGLKAVAPAVEAAYARSRIVGNEILVSCVGSVGAVALVGPEDVGSNIARAVARIPIESPQLRRYIATYLETPMVQRYFRAELRTVAQPTLNIRQMKDLEVPVPTDQWLFRFDRIARVVERQKSNQRASLAQLDTLFLSLQHRAFAGAL